MVNWNGISIPDFVLGTAQLGMSYGIANVSGRPSNAEGFALVSRAMSRGYSWFDTAQAYGESEQVLGRIFSHFSEMPYVITKLDPGLDPSDSDGIVASIQLSCERLGVTSLFGVMLHRASWLGHWDTVLVGLRRARDLGLVSYFGVSVYSPDELDAVLTVPELMLIQVPFNAWDPRFVVARSFEKARDAGRCCFLRSVYLQGLLVMSSEDVLQRLPGLMAFLFCGGNCVNDCSSLCKLWLLGMRDLLDFRW